MNKSLNAPLQNGALIHVSLDTAATDTSGNTVNDIPLAQESARRRRSMDANVSFLIH